MRLNSLELELEWPIDVPLISLRLLILDKLKVYGEPLRWAITGVKTSGNTNSFRKIKVEGVILGK
ncbi:hypothetical protein [Prochlorococcus marinus]|uniref:Uncharacterized protein n=1 Tax=Prochlorococcus marinus (strain MIT 9211) TaxID=93059 RepID=A9BCD7_PROM4|nr:hypothetical protein [Prochlorococcus marinus]ABX09499.1 Hypothetical protein P9211_15681 [Prochlorococcus marinus str. MIT 9211]